jgi:hypothetical protein
MVLDGSNTGGTGVEGCINPEASYFSGPRTPDGAAAICSPGPAKRDRISE